MKDSGALGSCTIRYYTIQQRHCTTLPIHRTIQHSITQHLLHFWSQVVPRRCVCFAKQQQQQLDLILKSELGEEVLSSSTPTSRLVRVPAVPCAPVSTSFKCRKEGRKEGKAPLSSAGIGLDLFLTPRWRNESPLCPICKYAHANELAKSPPPPSPTSWRCHFPVRRSAQILGT